MKTIIFSKDEELIRFISSSLNSESEIIIYRSIDSPIDAFALTIVEHPALLIIDDDLIKPNTVSFLKNIKSIGKQNFIILITSNESLDFGREVSSLGVLHYSIKPCNFVILNEFITSIIKYTINIK
jgi:two-component SAPR family response regulator